MYGTLDELKARLDWYLDSDELRIGESALEDATELAVCTGANGQKMQFRGWCGRWPLDRVLCGEAEQPLVAAEGCGESEKCQVVAGMAFVAVAESAVAAQPGRSRTHRRRPNRSLDSTPLRAIRTPMRLPIAISAGEERRRPCLRGDVRA